MSSMNQVGLATLDQTLAALDRILYKLAAHCAAEGTDPGRIARTVLWIAPVIPDAAGGAAFVEQLRPYAAIGVEQVHVMPLSGDPVPFAEGLAAHVVPALDGLA